MIIETHGRVLLLKDVLDCLAAQETHELMSKHLDVDLVHVSRRLVERH